MIAQIRRLRTEARWTQAELAKMLGTTQQTVARWESGKSEPNIKALKDLAMIFGCSVGDLLEMSENHSPPSVRHYRFAKSFDGFWGHFGVRLDGSGHTRWYPVSLGEADRVRNCLSSCELLPWVSVWTLNNRVLYINTDNVSRVFLIDDDCDPGEDWDHEEQALGYEQGIEAEICKALESWLNREGDSDGWEIDASENYRATVLDFIKEHELDVDSVEMLILYTHVYFSDGKRLSYWADVSDVYDLDFSAEMGDVAGLVELSTVEHEGFFFPARKIAMVDTPQALLLAEFNRVDAELEKELPQTND